MHTHGKWVLTVLWAASLAAFPQTRTRITLNIVAFDNHDQIVSDLTGKELQVSDDSKSQRIVSFRHEEPQVSPPVVVLFDLLNDNLSNRGYGAQEISQALEPLESSDSLYLYLLTNEGRLKLVRGLPSHQDEIEVENPPWTKHIRPLLEAAIGNAYGLRQDFLNNADLTFSAIGTLGEELTRFPGRKQLLWITHDVPVGYPVPQKERRREERLRGVPSVETLGTAIDSDGVTFSSVYQGTGLGGANTEILEQFAQLSGGTVYRNDIHKAVKEALAGSRSSYVIEYDAPRPDGKYHKIRVACSRKGVHLEVKQGYYAN